MWPVRNAPITLIIAHGPRAKKSTIVADRAGETLLSDIADALLRILEAVDGSRARRLPPGLLTARSR
jgi:hypothetical protein